MKKQTIRKDDGRYLIFYAFDKPLPKVNQPEQPTSEQPTSDHDSLPEPNTQAGGDRDV